MISEEHNETEILCEDLRSGNTKNNRRTIIKLHRKSTYSAPTDDPDKGKLSSKGNIYPI